MSEKFSKEFIESINYVMKKAGIFKAVNSYKIIAKEINSAPEALPQSKSDEGKDNK